MANRPEEEFGFGARGKAEEPVRPPVPPSPLNGIEADLDEEAHPALAEVLKIELAGSDTIVSAERVDISQRTCSVAWLRSS